MRPAAFLLVVFTLLLPVSAVAQMMPPYNWLTFMQFSAKVESINTLRNPKSGGIGLHLFARDIFSNLYLVHVCPQWYADNHPDQFAFRPGDQLVISGSRFATGLTPNNILAATIINCSRNYLELRVRDPLNGNILWNNQPDHLLERILEIQKKLFSKQSETLRRRAKERILNGKNDVAVQLRDKPLR
jgi:hypothetical protein